jgi:hypothetical protein
MRSLPLGEILQTLKESTFAEESKSERASPSPLKALNEQTSSLARGTEEEAEQPLVQIAESEYKTSPVKRADLDGSSRNDVSLELLDKLFKSARITTGPGSVSGYHS